MPDEWHDIYKKTTDGPRERQPHAVRAQDEEDGRAACAEEVAALPQTALRGSSRDTFQRLARDTLSSHVATIEQPSSNHRSTTDDRHEGDRHVMTEAGTDHQMGAVLAWTLAVGWWICYPIGILLWYLALALVFIFQLLFGVLAFLLRPVVYLGRFVLACLALPYAIAVRLETIYIYLGVAAIVGILGGFTARGIYCVLYHLLRLDVKPLAPRGRTVQQYREEKRKRKMEAETPLLSPSLSHPRPLSPGTPSLSDGARRGRGLLVQTIHEEDDSDF